MRNGYLPEREVLTGVGEVTIHVPKTRDSSGAGRKVRSELLPPCLKRTNRLEAVQPWSYLKGESTNTISRLKTFWEEEYEAWRNTDRSDREFVYLWADGFLLQHPQRRSSLRFGGDWLRCVGQQAFPGY